MVKDHSETRCRQMGYCFRLAARVLIYMHHPTDRITPTTAFVTPVVEHWLEQEELVELVKQAPEASTLPIRTEM